MAYVFHGSLLFLEFNSFHSLFLALCSTFLKTFVVHFTDDLFQVEVLMISKQWDGCWRIEGRINWINVPWLLLLGQDSAPEAHEPLAQNLHPDWLIFSRDNRRLLIDPSTRWLLWLSSFGFCTLWSFVLPPVLLSLLNTPSWTPTSMAGILKWIPSRFCYGTIAFFPDLTMSRYNTCPRSQSIICKPNKP